jgi:serine protease Do
MSRWISVAIYSSVLCLSMVFSTLQAQPSNTQFQKSNSEMFAAMTEVVAKPSAFTVRVRCADKDAALGTIVGPDGWIVTKYSELKGPAKVVLKDGRDFDAIVVGVHDEADLAMLKISATILAAADWRESKAADVGSWLATPGISKEPIAVGVVSVNARVAAKEPAGPNMNSGFLGIQMVPDESGVKVQEVQPRTAAQKAGIKAGDVIVGIDDTEVSNRDQLMELLQTKKPGDTVTVKLLRDGTRMELKATLGRRTLDRGSMQNSMGSVLSERRTNFPVILQHDSVIKPTDCGGPVVDLDGRVVGINIARAGRTESYALPSEFVQSVLFDLMSGKLPGPVSTKPKTAAVRLAEAEAIKARALASKTAAEKDLKEAEAAIAKAKQEIEAERIKAEAEKKKAEADKKKAEPEKKPE